ncbi:MAG: deoxynucleoside kinase [Actinomycetota bacterium]
MRYVAIDGPTGVGKSTTSRLLANRLGLPLLLDPVSASPLLDDYYVGYDTTESALAAEMAFLDLRASLVTIGDVGERDVRDDTAFGVDAVSDFTVLRTGPFAHFLDDVSHRRRVLDELERRLASCVGPSAFVLLDAPAEVLLERVRLRNRDAEHALDLGHLRALTGFFAEWRDRLLAQTDRHLVIDTTTWDPHRPAHLDTIVDWLERTAP